MALDSRGNLYVVDFGNKRIRRIGTDGIVNTVAGGGTLEPSDGVLATQANPAPHNVAVDRQDRVLFADGRRIWRVESDGRLTRVAGLGPAGLAPDGALAREALMVPFAMSVAPNGDIFASEFDPK